MGFDRTRGTYVIFINEPKLVDLILLRDFNSISNVLKLLLCAAIAAFQAGGSLEQAVNLLSLPDTKSTVDGQPDSVPTVSGSEDASSSISNIEEIQDMLDNFDNGEGPSTVEENRDSEMESELARELDGASAVSDYDMDVTKEGEAITEYLALLDSLMNSEKA